MGRCAVRHLYFGFGEGQPNPAYYNEPTNAFILRIHDGAVGNRIDAVASAGGVWQESQVGLGHSFGSGDRFRIEKCGDTVTLSIVGTGVSYTFNTGADLGGTINDTNGHIFFGNSATGTVLSDLSVSGSLLTNGSFEKGPYADNGDGYQTIVATSTAIAGWTVTQQNVDWVGAHWGASDGVPSLDMSGTPGYGAISQTFATTAGQEYEVTFDLAGNFACGSSLKRLEVTVADHPSVFFEFDTAGKTRANMGWESQSFTFVAALGTTESKITFRATTNNNHYCGPAIDNVVVVGETPAPTLAVTIDVKPGSDTNPVNLKSKGVIPVAILGADDFDASEVDGSTVVFAGASPDHGEGHLEDVDQDGDLDWVGHFRTQDTSIGAGDTEAGLTGQTNDGQDLEGSDVISISKGSGKGRAGKLALGFGVENYPNPANPSTTLRYSLPEDSRVRLVIFNALGQSIRTLVNEQKQAGVYTVRWDGLDAAGGDVTSGVYLYSLEAGEHRLTRKLMLLK